MEIQRLDGATIAVTGATSGIGYFIAEGLAHLGASVIIAGRSIERGRIAVAQLPQPQAHRFVLLDLSDIDSVRNTGDHLGSLERLDGLVMNAGLIAAPRTYQTGPFGVESTVAVNVLSHMELLRLSLPALTAASNARVVSVGSMLTRRIPFDRDNWLAQQSYHPRVAYAMSRHAAEILGFELGLRLAASGSTIESVVTHPGGAIDALSPDRPGINERSVITRTAAQALGPLFRSMVQGKESAAQPAVTAMAASSLPAGAYIGPRRVATGEPILSNPVHTSRDPALGTWLWGQTQKLLGSTLLTL
ncbi:SDR family NAD(P)-dependent oxidoreductase [Arthrobacter sp. MI7-26]|uniref:SDR family NAD(P)-dependent oxidoreductase n=1 Tax=Arthrobacter sp. MI7-26 TaxID=2993653 RepID=UPI002248A83F|nr:SDR family NAD(P)-dependent oxidoreductase [Arthrobacter sp. MI7-26]MCX2748082.1 SDR family NAD(P)-dependent oxidoreductase [Arthrobacter sp. MI7-26]